MRTIRRTRPFRRDYRREKPGRYRDTLDAELDLVVRLLAADDILPERYHDHALIGRWISHRECHIHPNLLLIYRKPDAETLELVHLGSHSELRLA